MGGIGDLATPLLTSVARHVLPAVLPAAIESSKSKRQETRRDLQPTTRLQAATAEDIQHANHSLLRLRRRRIMPAARPTEELRSDQITKQPAYSQHCIHHKQTQQLQQTQQPPQRNKQHCRHIASRCVASAPQRRRCRATHTHRIDALLRAASRQPCRRRRCLRY